MNSKKYIPTKTQTTINLIGESNHLQFLKIQVSYGFAHRGGVSFPFPNESHSKRLISDVNILTSNENQQIVFSESIFSN